MAESKNSGAYQSHQNRGNQLIFIAEAIQELENYIDGSKASMFSAQNVTLNRNQLKLYLENIRKAIPREVERANYILTNAQNIVRQAQDDAEKISTEVRLELGRTLQNTEIVRKAEEEATVIKRQAEERIKNAEDQLQEFIKEQYDILYERVTEIAVVLQQHRDDLDKHGMQIPSEDLYTHF